MLAGVGWREVGCVALHSGLQGFIGISLVPIRMLCFVAAPLSMEIYGDITYVSALIPDPAMRCYPEHLAWAGAIIDFVPQPELHAAD